MLPLALLILASAQAAPTAPADPFAAIEVYNGAWSITTTPAGGSPGKPDSLVNHCIRGLAFYACEQVVNGKPVALVVFTATDEPGKFHSQAILPDGHAAGRTDLILDGPHWTYQSGAATPAPGETLHRTENYFTGPDHIHYDQLESTDGKTWIKKSQGDEVRIPTP